MHSGVYLWGAGGTKKTLVDGGSLCRHSINIDGPEDAYAGWLWGFAGTVCPGERPVLFIVANDSFYC